MEIINWFFAIWYFTPITNAQIPVAVIQPPMIAVPPPIHIAMAVPIPVQIKKTTTTTTTKRPATVVVPIGVPVFTAPLTPVGFPILPVHPPVLIIPFHSVPTRIRTSCERYSKNRASESDSSTSGETSSSCDSSYRRQLYIKKDQYAKTKRRYKYFSRNRRQNSRGDTNQLIKPVLTYINDNGLIKIQKRLSQSEAKNLLDKNGSTDSKEMENLQVVSRSSPRDRQLPVSKSLLPSEKHSRRHQIFKNPPSHVLRTGKKEILLVPENNKKITNLTLSFQVV
ncbi:hypothetical protein ACJJTC_003577 [Scirpophaga incertulas]